MVVAIPHRIHGEVSVRCRMIIRRGVWAQCRRDVAEIVLRVPEDVAVGKQDVRPTVMDIAGDM